MTVLDVQGLTVELRIDGQWHEVIGDVGFTVEAGETVGIVGESGSGKTMTGLAMLGLAPPTARVTGGRAVLDGVDLLGLDERALSRVRGRDVGMIFQEPRRSLNPAFTVGEQVAEVVRRHQGLNRRQAWARAVELLDLVAIPDASRRAHDHPHRFSGGMCQRVMLAMAIACEPKLLVADEPTTALDVTVQAHVLELIARLRRELGLAVLFITHDLGVVAEVCDRMVVLYAGHVVETGTVAETFATPRHPYTAALLGCIPDVRHHVERLGAIAGSVPSVEERPGGCRFHPRCPHAVDDCAASVPVLVELGPASTSRCLRTDLPLAGVGAADEVPAPVVVATVPDDDANDTTPEPVLVVEGVSRRFVLERDLVGRPRHVVTAATGVDLTVPAGRTLALVGESGVGKSTLGRMVLALIDADDGRIDLLGTDVRRARGEGLRRLRRDAAMVFQNPYTSFDPRMLVADAVGEPLDVHGIGSSSSRAAKVTELLDAVGLTARHGARYPYELSGGELQRAAIARALTTDPAFIVCDEPVAALDMSIRAGVVNLLRDLQAERGVAYLFITHDLALVRIIAHEVAVMQGGEIVERGSADTLFAHPQHPYTKALLDAVPVPDPRRRGRYSAATPR